jgi:hypothetical protein
VPVTIRSKPSPKIPAAEGSLYFDFKDMNGLKFFDAGDPRERRGFPDILVPQRDGAQPDEPNWRPARARHRLLSNVYS